MRVLSVDLGTSNTVAVLSAYGRPPRVIEVDGSATMPSAVFVTEDGRLVVGRDAERQARLDPSRFEPNPKRRVDETTLLLGSSMITVTDALSAVLARVAQETSRQLDGAYPDELRLTHPARWGAPRRNALIAAARLAGFTGNVVLIPEPAAAAAHFASFPDRALTPGQALAVYDLGAGTFDVAVVGVTPDGFTVLAEDGLPDLGGLDVDHALLVHVGREVSFRDPARWQRLLRPESIADRRARRTLLEDVREAKEALSRYQQTEVPMPEEFSDVLVTRTELEALIRPNLLRSVDLLAATIQRAGLTPATLAGIYLVGGSSRIPLVAQLIAERLGVVPTSLDQPETAVALGAHHVSAQGSGTYAPSAQSVADNGQVTNPHPVVLGAPTSGFSATGNGYPAVLPQHYPTLSPADRPASPTRNRRLLLAGIAAAVVIAVGVTLGIFVFGNQGLPAAQDCQTQGELDDRGFSRCTKQLAGLIADSDKCTKGLATTPASEELAKVPGAQITCKIDGGIANADVSVSYVHTESQKNATDTADAVFRSAGTGERVEADWEGNGLKGRYRAIVNGSVGTVVFTVADRPLVGALTTVNTGDTKITANMLADLFEQKVQPGN